MLKLLFGQESKIKLLNLFLLHPDRSYELANISQETGLTTAQINKGLLNLKELGLVEEVVVKATSSKAAGKTKAQTPAKKTTAPKESKIFVTNKNFLLYPELRALLVKAQIISSQHFITSLEKNFQPQLILLTGLFVNQPESLTDLLIVGNIKRPLFLKLIAELEKDLGREINFTIMSEAEFYYRREIVDIFLYNILEGEKIILINSLND
ncbi:MAG: PASTA domain-containing protein [Patescibacteria group bacterium]|jgi:hypothetical protein